MEIKIYAGTPTNEQVTHTLLHSEGASVKVDLFNTDQQLVNSTFEIQSAEVVSVTFSHDSEEYTAVITAI
jgi:hypothetical protein